MSCAPHSGKRPKPQPMRPWLEMHIDRGDINGLHWIDKKNKVFVLPWRHHGSKGWKEADGQVYKEWSKHKGYYKEGFGKPDWTTWKTRLRNALNKLQDIKEVKDGKYYREKTDENSRLFQFVTSSSKKENNKHSTAEQRSNCDVNNSFSKLLLTQPCIPVTVLSAAMSGMLTTNSELDNIPSDNLCMHDKQDTAEQYENMDTSEDIPVDSTVQLNESQIQEIANKANKIYPFQIVPAPVVLPCHSFDPTDSGLRIIIKYLQDIQLCENIRSENGCRIFYDVGVDITAKGDGIYNTVFGPKDAQQIPLPECRSDNNQNLKQTLQILHAMDRGVLVKKENGNIIATRKCRCSVYVMSPSLDIGKVIRLKRDEPTLIFSLEDYFKPAFDRYLKKGPMPSAEVFMGFGQNITQTPNATYISASIVHTEADTVLKRTEASDSLFPSIDISKSDDYDRTLDVMKYTRESQSEPINN